MSGTTYRIFGVAGLILLALFLWWGSQHFGSSYQTITDDLAQYDELGTKVAEDFSAYPLVSLNDEYTITDTLKDGVEITYGNTGAAAASGDGDHSGPLGQVLVSATGTSAAADPTTFTSPDQQQSISLQFPQTLNEPISITLPGGRVFTVTHNDATDYISELLSNEQVIDEGAADTVLLGDHSGPLGQVLVSSKEVSAAPSYVKYQSPDSRLTTYYAYQKDQAAGYRNLKHWTIFKSGTGHETQSYTFKGAHLTTNDRGEVEVRYIAPIDESMKAQVDDNLWARAQAVLAQDLEASIDGRAPDLTIPAPYTIDANGTKTTLEWTVMKASDYDPGNTTNDYILSVSFEVPLLGYPIALDPTLQFTAPGVSNAGDYITGETTSNYFGSAFTTGDFNADGNEDLVVSAYYYNSNHGRVYIFYGGSINTRNANTADVVLTGESSSNFGYSLATGDFNADGKDDLIVGEYLYSSWTGRSYIFYGGAMINESASGADVTLTGASTDTYFGWSLTTGDFNADGKDDVAVGAYRYSSLTGRAYIFYGGNMVSETASGADITLTGSAMNVFFSHSLTTGDFNADGKDDIAVGAYGYNSSQGRVYIFYGGSMISETAAGADITLTGGTTGDRFGHSLTTGNLNADGKVDLVVGAYTYNSSQGRAYVFYGGSMISEGAAGADITLTGETTSNYFGDALITGDFNADGKDDLAVGAYWYNSYQGRVYIFYGGSMSSKNASAADVIFTGEATNNFFGHSLITGDLNSDGKVDLVVGGYRYNSFQGRTYIFYSQSGQVNLNQHITGEGTSDYFGSAFTVGDFNADGRPDLAVGAYLDNTSTGKVYIFYNDGSYPTGAASADVILTGGATSNYFGHRLVSGDFNTDGKDDLAVGAYGYSTNTGRTYIFYGGSMISEGVAGADVTITGEATNNHLGSSMMVGDWNADGKDDLAVGAVSYPSFFNFTGRVYIFNGGSIITENASGADVILTGNASANYFGDSITTGDFNNDGKEDIVVGAHGITTNTGAAYIFYGGSMVSETASGADVTMTGGATNNAFGNSVATGDFNNDGKDDLAVGAYGYGTNQGQVYFFYGGSITNESVSGADVTITGEASGNYFSFPLVVGDYNHDGKDDLAVGAWQYNTYTGRTYIFYNDGSYPSSAANADIIITGDATNNDSGYALAAGDFDNDGRTDLVIGSPGYNAGGDTGRISFYQTRENYAWEIQRQSLADGLRVDPLMGYEMKITGETTSNSFGTSIALGDLNNDGKDDLIVGSPGYNSNQGRVYIFYNDGNYPTKAGRADVILTGEAVDSNFGYSVASGDFNADGKLDLVVGGYGYNTATGRTYVFYGGSIISKNASAASLLLTGGTTNNYFGRSVAGGDFNNDGKDDLAIGAYGYSTNKGRVYIFYGGTMTSEDVSGADVTLTGGATANDFGYSLVAGDLNADGKDDVVVGARGYNTYKGRAYVFYGGSIISEDTTGAEVTLTGGGTGDEFGHSLVIGDLNSDGKDDLLVGSWVDAVYLFYGGTMTSEDVSGADVTLTGDSSYTFGAALTSGDFNNDGREDLAIGAKGYSTNTGRTYIFYNDGSIPTTAATADVILTGESTNTNYGSALAAGDLNADGTDDLIVGATGYNSSQGRLYFYTTNDFQLTGGATNNYFGFAMTTGDYNADGKTDLAVGAYQYTTSIGRVYIFYGGSLKSETTSGADVILSGQATSYYFGAALTTGDFNADGKDDIAVGAYRYTTYTGRVYIFYGGSMISEDTTGADITLTGESANNYFGSKLTTGDLNADGKDDLVVCSYGYFPSGRMYVFYGGSMISENASGADVILTGVSGDNLGYSLTVGDFNADGKADIAAGAYYGSQGKAFIFYGGSMLSEDTSGADVVITGEAVLDFFAIADLITGDFNLDGKDDLVATAYNYNSGQGRVYIFYGGDITTGSAAAASIILSGETASDSLGNALTTGDFNVDGKDDLVVSATSNSSSRGRVYILYGGRLSTKNIAGADIGISGLVAGDLFGGKMIADDLNRDGIDDLMVATPYSSSGTGKVYVLMSEAATVKYSKHQFQGTLKYQGTGTFH